MIADTSVEEFVERASAGAPVQVRSPRIAELREALDRAAITAVDGAPDELIVSGASAARIGDLAAELGVPLHALTLQQISLEDAFMQITRSSVEFHTGLAETERDLMEAA